MYMDVTSLLILFSMCNLNIQLLEEMNQKHNWFKPSLDILQIWTAYCFQSMTVDMISSIFGIGHLNGQTVTCNKIRTIVLPSGLKYEYTKTFTTKYDMFW